MTISPANDNLSLMKTVISSNLKQTMEIGKQLADELNGGDILCLYGDLGAGKTALTKGIALGLGIKKEITSPTFVLMNHYNIKTLKHKNIKTLVHIDTYRLKNEQELLDIGAQDYLGADDTVCVIEWPEKIEKLLPTGGQVKKITIEHLDGEKRKITIK